MGRISTGIEGLDRMLHEGLIPGRPYVVSGPPGGGRSILAMHFLMEGIRNNESVILVTVDEPPNEIKANLAQFGWNLDRIRILDATPDIKPHTRTKSIIDVGTTLDIRDMEQVKDIRRSQQLRVMEVTIHSVQKMLKQEFFDHLNATGKMYSRIVLDSLTSLRLFSMKGQDAQILVESFMRFLSELEATSLIVSERFDPTELETEFLLSRGEIRLHKWLDSYTIKRAVSIDKFRGSSFDDRFRPLHIGPHGITVDPEGTVVLRGPEADLMEKSFLEALIAEEVLEVLEEVLRGMEECQKLGIDVQDLQVPFSKALISFHLKRHEEVMKFAIVCLDIIRMRTSEAGPRMQAMIRPQKRGR